MRTDRVEIGGQNRGGYASALTMGVNPRLGPKNYIHRSYDGQVSHFEDLML